MFYFRDNRLLISLNMVPSKTYDIILDVGAGDGMFARMLTKRFRGANVVCIDSSPKTLRKAAKYKNHLAYVVADVRCLPFRTCIADLCSLLEVIEHLDEENGRKAMEEVIRVLKREGFLLFSTPNRASLTGVTSAFIHKILRKKWSAWDSSHIRLYTPAEVEHLIRNFGLLLLRMKGYWFLPGTPLYWFSPRGSLHFIDPTLRKHYWYRKFSSYNSEKWLGVRLGLITLCLAKK